MAKTTTIQIIAAAIVYLFAVSCANQIPPSGGPPDTVPPKIIEIIPNDQTINYKETTIEITFSEYVNKRSVQESIFISPNIDGMIEYDWSGKTLEIELPDSLRENTTYTITIGTDVQDINNSNNMAQSFTFAFSTGNKIDRGTISGSVFDKKPSGVMIYAYKIVSDTLNPTKQKPDYITQAGINGEFNLSGLSDGLYRVFAVRDEFKDFIYDPTQDMFGAPYAEINLGVGDSLFTGMNYRLQIEDTSKPRVFGLTMTDARHILVEFSEPVDSTKITNENFFVYDSTNNTESEVAYFFKGKTKSKNYLIALADTLQPSEQWYLISKNIPDHFGNLMDYESTSFVRNTKPDTLNNELFNMMGKYPGGKIDFNNGVLTLKFLDGFNHSKLQDMMEVLNPKEVNVPYKIQSVDDAEVKLIFSELDPDKEYEVQIDQKALEDVAGNFADTVLSRKFSTISKLDFTGLSGEVVDADNLNVVVTITNLNNPEIKYTYTGTSFNFERVYPGQYQLSAFDDRNKNNKYDKGGIYPYEPAERFVFYPDTLELKARWPVGDVKLSFE